MGSKNSKLHMAMTDIVGVWYNPITKNSCCFYAMKNASSFAVMDVFQHDSKANIKFEYRIVEINDVLYLDIENDKFEILELSLEPKAILSLETEDKNLIMLYKDY